VKQALDNDTIPPISHLIANFDAKLKDYQEMIGLDLFFANSPAHAGMHTVNIKQSPSLLNGPCSILGF
jgi:hypothetical protein